MKRKKMIKLLMSWGIPRNEAVGYADACGGEMPHRHMLFFVMFVGGFRELVCSQLTQILQGTSFKVHLERGGYGKS